MHRRFVHYLPAAAAVAGLALCPALAHAGRYDLDLTPLGHARVAAGQPFPEHAVI